ncbi:MAG: hypothetical protein ACYDC6_02655 [Acidobacteriaceae bacterium]
MADSLYYSLWFPNFRFSALPEKLALVMQQLPQPLVAAASVYPLSWQQTPGFQRIFATRDTYPEQAVAPEVAVAEATELLQDDCAYEFELAWNLWYPETDGLLDPIWKEEMRLIRIIGQGPDFDLGAFEQNGHILIDLGLDTPFLCEDTPLDEEGQLRVQQNVEQLVAFTTAVEKNCGVQTRLLWSESEDNLAQKLIARLQKLN